MKTVSLGGNMLMFKNNFNTKSYAKIIKFAPVINNRCSNFAK